MEESFELFLDSNWNAAVDLLEHLRYSCERDIILLFGSGDERLARLDGAGFKLTGNEKIDCRTAAKEMVRLWLGLGGERFLGPMLSDTWKAIMRQVQEKDNEQGNAND